MNVAFINVDVQQYYAELEKFKPFINQSIETINYVSALFRDANQPVIHIQHAHAAEGPGSDGFEVAAEITQSSQDYYITKSYGNAFWQTPLHDLLIELKVDFVVIAGLSATQCVVATLNGAVERDFGAVLLQNGVLDVSQENIDVIMNAKPVISYPAIKKLLTLIRS